MGNGGHQHLRPLLRQRRASDRHCDSDSYSDSDSDSDPHAHTHADICAAADHHFDTLDHRRWRKLRNYRQPFQPRRQVNCLSPPRRARSTVARYGRSSKSSTQLIVAIPSTVTLGEGFAEVQVVNTDQGFKVSNSVPALLQGAARRRNSDIDRDQRHRTGRNQQQSELRGQQRRDRHQAGRLGDTGRQRFRRNHGVAVNVFCACTGGKVGPFL